MAAFLLEQAFNGIQYGLMLFLVAMGVTLVFGVMHVINLSHGSILMIGCFLAASFTAAQINIYVAVILALLAVALFAVCLEQLVVRRLYAAGELDQVLATFGLVLMANDGVAMIWGKEPLFLPIPSALSGSINLGWFHYPVYRLAIISVAILAGLMLYVLLAKTRLGMRIRAGRDDRDMVAKLGLNVDRLFLVVFVLAAVLAALGGIMLAPLMAVLPGMGDPLLILSLTIVIIGGIGSVAGTLLAAIGFGVADTFARAFLPTILGDTFGSIVSNVTVYLILIVLILAVPSYRATTSRS